ncbi:MAG TPA: sigma-70 family RNA polymerase sigma factor [Candidatus Merdenecus merdavium]|nr:sigma-70 family RNA polymerase sigma factor [Candidatus Merdenecus merdavium]
MTDQEFFQGILEKDEKVFQEFYFKYYKLCYKVIEDTLKDQYTVEEAKDCLSESMIYIWFNIRKYDPKKYNFRNWFTLIVYSRAYNKKKQLDNENRKIEKFRRKNLHKNKSYSPEELLIMFENNSMIYEMIENLNDPMKEIAKRRFIDGEKPSTISKNLKIPIKSVHNYIFRAKKILKERRNNHE